MLQERAEAHFVVADESSIEAQKVQMLRVEDYYQALELLKKRSEEQNKKLKWQK